MIMSKKNGVKDTARPTVMWMIFLLISLDQNFLNINSLNMMRAIIDIKNNKNRFHSFFASS